jgi:hypothetical protein
MHERTIFMFAYTVYIFMCLIKEGASITYAVYHQKKTLYINFHSKEPLKCV